MCISFLTQLKHALRPKLLLSTACIGLVVGCSHVPLGSVPSLAAIDFRTTEFADFRAAIELPDTLELSEESVRLLVNLTIEGAVAEERAYSLQQTAVSEEALLASLDVQDGRHAFVYQLSPQDQRGMNAIRRAIFAAEQADQSGSLSMRIETNDVCTTGPLGEEPLLVDVFLKSTETGRFVRTLDGYDLRELSDLEGAQELTVEPCLG